MEVSDSERVRVKKIKMPNSSLRPGAIASLSKVGKIISDRILPNTPTPPKTDSASHRVVLDGF